MRNTFEQAKFLLFITSCLLLSACGGGSSSSGGGGVDKSATPFAGNYSGIENLSLTGPGGSFLLGVLPISIAIDGNGRVVVTDSDGIPYVGQLGDPIQGLPPNQFIATAFISIPSGPEFTCIPGTYGYAGNIVGDTITGNASGTFVCSGMGVSGAVILSGPFNATRVAGATPQGSTSPGIQQPAGTGVGGARKSHKQRLILDAMDSIL